jgi:hypothetical protein
MIEAQSTRLTSRGHDGLLHFMLLHAQDLGARLLRHVDCRLTRPMLKACATMTEGVRLLMLKMSNLLCCHFESNGSVITRDETVLRKRYLLN